MCWTAMRHQINALIRFGFWACNILDMSPRRPLHPPFLPHRPETGAAVLLTFDAPLHSALPFRLRAEQLHRRNQAHLALARRNRESTLGNRVFIGHPFSIWISPPAFGSRIVVTLLLFEISLLRYLRQRRAGNHSRSQSQLVRDDGTGL